MTAIKQKIIAVFGILIVVLVGYWLLDLYIERVGREMVQNWLDSEAVDLQQGNFLTSVAKTQRIQLGSDFIKSVVLWRKHGERNEVLVATGRYEDVSKFICATEVTPNSIRAGLFRHIISTRFSNHPGLCLSFVIQPLGLSAVFGISLVVFFLMLVGFIVLFNHFKNIESERRGHLLIAALNDMVTDAPPSPFLQKLAPRVVEQWAVMRNKLESANRDKVSLEIDAQLATMAKQVSHDIRSPLSALNMVLGTLHGLPEDRRLIIRNATQRINDIANGLLQQGKNSASGNEPALSHQELAVPVMLVALLDAIVSEKRLQYRERMEVEIQGDLSQGYGLFAEVNAVEFSRAISNLINNSIEALTSSGRVLVAIRGSKDQIAVSIIDTGKGISPELLAKLGERGVTHGKQAGASGSGLGIYHAKTTIEAVGGRLSIQSKVESGTIVTLTLPRAETPLWFVDKISVVSGATIVSADDDQTIHQIWSGRLSSAASEGSQVKHVAFSSLDLFESWILENVVSSTLCLVDFEFIGQSGNGLDVIERCGIAKHSILVSSRYEEPHVRSRAEALGIRILPKSLAPFVPLEIVKGT